jgi:hypothetical protein
MTPNPHARRWYGIGRSTEDAATCRHEADLGPKGRSRCIERDEPATQKFYGATVLVFLLLAPVKANERRLLAQAHVVR